MEAITARVPGSIDDEAIVQRVLAGEVALFELLMRRHNQRIYRTIRSILRDEDGEVEEAMQQAYVSAWLHLGQFTGGARFSTWLTRIAINEALARRRKERRFVALDGGSIAEEAPSGAPGPEEQVARRELVALVERAIDSLPEAGRSVLVLREVEGLSTAETAEILGVSEDAVKQRLHRARELLRARLDEEAEGALAAAWSFEAPRCDRVVRAVMERITR